MGRKVCLLSLGGWLGVSGFVLKKLEQRRMGERPEVLDQVQEGLSISSVGKDILNKFLGSYESEYL